MFVCLFCIYLVFFPFLFVSHFVSIFVCLFDAFFICIQFCFLSCPCFVLLICFSTYFSFRLFLDLFFCVSISMFVCFCCLSSLVSVLTECVNENGRFHKAGGGITAFSVVSLSEIHSKIPFHVYVVFFL